MIQFCDEVHILVSILRSVLCILRGLWCQPPGCIALMTLGHDLVEVGKQQKGRRGANPRTRRPNPAQAQASQRARRSDKPM